MTTLLHTPRCTVRAFTEGDFDLLYSLHSNPDIMYYIGQGPRSVAQVQQHLTNIIQHQNTHGYSAWAAFEKESGTFIGRIGLVHMGTLIAMHSDPAQDVPVELGYVLAKEHWGKGYATEVSLAALEWGFANTDLAEIVAKTNIANYSSQSILKKVGMTFRRNVMIEGREGMFFSILREEFEQQQAKRAIG